MRGLKRLRRLMQKKESAGNKKAAFSGGPYIYPFSLSR
jgi:hypothetical protein